MDKNLVPALSVILPAYNAAHFLTPAIKGILEQTFTNFELIVINDGSTDGTSKILTDFEKRDSRLRVLSQKNKGLVASLNRGIKEARAPLIARHDADDISDKTRFQKQVDLFTAHPSLTLVGSSMKVMNDEGEVLHNHAVLLNNDELKHELMVRSPFPHGSVMFRRNAALEAGLYEASAWPAEDYDFWVRLSQHGDFANIDEYLYIYRENSNGISATRQAEQILRTKAAQKKAWSMRRQLLERTRINLQGYASLDMGTMRQDRILDNVRFVHARAVEERDIWTLIHNARVVIGNRLLYRRKLGKIKRRLLKK